MGEGYHSPRAQKRKTRKEEREQIKKERAENKEREKNTLRPEESRYVKEMLEPDVDRGEAARRAGISSIPKRPIVERTLRVLGFLALMSNVALSAMEMKLKPTSFSSHVLVTACEHWSC